jgi:hypothetical protein
VQPTFRTADRKFDKNPFDKKKQACSHTNLESGPSTVHHPPTKRWEHNVILLTRKQNADNITDEDVMEVHRSKELDLETASKTGKRPPVHGPLVK